MMDLGQTLLARYAEGQNDYWMPPLVALSAGGPLGRIQAGDAVIFCCRRGEREVQLTEAFVEPDFPHFPRPKLAGLLFATLVEYHQKFALPTIVPPVRPEHTLPEVLSTAGLRQISITESEKEPHVTFFFNGRRNLLFPGQDCKIIPSLRDVEGHPEMRSREVGEAAVEALGRYDFLLVNFPAGDVIGHLPDWEAKKAAARAVDEALGAIAVAAAETGTTLLLTADHGLMESEGISHTSSLVPFIAADGLIKPSDLARSQGSLVDVAPTILALLGVPAPAEMEGIPILRKGLSADRIILVILDGWGEGSSDPRHNPLVAADLKVLPRLKASCPCALLQASGRAVGLPDGRSGNSETGHLTIGAGRRIEQDELRLQRVFASGLKDNQALTGILKKTNSSGCRLHLLGLLSESSSHGSIQETLALARIASASGVDPERLFLHLILDGRSAPPQGAFELLERFRAGMEGLPVVTAVGRGLALDRSRDYQAKTCPAYEALVLGKGEPYEL